MSIELIRSDRRRWIYRRRIPATNVIVTIRGGFFPAVSICDARQWATTLNAQVEAGIDPRAAEREARAILPMTVGRAHGLYMIAVHEGRASGVNRPNKPRTIQDKIYIYESDIAPALADKLIHEVTEADLVTLVLNKGKRAKIRANRLAAELNVFFGWSASLRGLEVGLPENPARRLSDLRFPETPRSRKLSLDEIGWFLRAVALEPLQFRRGWLLWLLTAVRRNELTEGRSSEVEQGVWTIPPERSKNGVEHVIALGPWASARRLRDG
ncbi:MAG: integrase arm-type DNA-binding domain-containing protein [Sphingomonas sp.]|nr:integrase arm-type DNA-binding domain-containing protein [Sphingomonas sp.]